jgi:hypothetical protein
VTSIASGTFQACSNLTSVTIASSVTKIEEYAFYNCSGLKIVYYTGTEEEWDKISIGTENTDLTDATRYYYSKTKPTKAGNWWHYVDGVPTVWE